MAKIEKPGHLMAADPPPLPPSVNEADVEYYRVRMNTVVPAHNTLFRPNVDYKVTPEIYNGVLDDGSTFKSKCSSVVPELRRAP